MISLKYEEKPETAPSASTKPDVYKRQGLIAGAALDVLSSEPIRSDSPLLKLADDDRLYITPHIAWASKEARTRLIGLVQKNIASYLEGGMENRVV